MIIIDYVNKLFSKFYEKQLSQFSLTFSQYLVLLTLWEESPQTLLAIGKKVNLASNTLTPLLKRLEQAVWVRRNRDESDKRNLIITLTIKGLNEQEAVHEAIAKCISSQFDLDEYTRAKAIMDNLEVTLKKLTKDYLNKKI
ncbi:MarR family winged helix-turn-helix transcriptional regulator [Staphylococcus aureus]|uniref:MarR family winged helix-turn-helix transcriptional regulator n=1 Tax=Staphylococcus aureus TaxID=1280 RepID=UPI0018EC5064|nr:MarR family transcriptional regulator [Staphylococcus aureus]MBJ6164699.1 MarR family transcriptional regulator [Staphylococcus aureus]MBJ6166031.1 MarR family transcriptional regulator [Staphylococcus aureus]MBJ6169446.1 MarR family transcriptional regulator [Staphylococcus aureus]MBJ6180060.1 MarR family transcriptional regulator [Staphylococcus aureus]MBJ6182653.1 MarR family transcriptional regulator [Staphylococcus aureus]